MNKEELLKEIMKLPKVETINSISAMNGINVDDLMSAIDRLNKVPDYNDLLKENRELKKQLEDANEKILLLQASEPMLNYKKALEVGMYVRDIHGRIDKIKELDDKLKDKEKRWEKVKQYIANIYDLDLEESDKNEIND